MNLDGYLLSIIGTVLLCSILTAVIPDGKTAGIIKGVARLVCLISIIAPIPYFLGKESVFDSVGEENAKNANGFFPQTVIQTDESFIKYYSELRIQETERLLKAELESRFDTPLQVTLCWKFDGEEKTIDADKIRITKIFIQPNERMREEEKLAMSEYLTKNYCSEVQIE